MTTLQPSADPTYIYVDNDLAGREMRDWIASADRVAIDIEADSRYHYYEKICLLQLTARGRNFVVDTLAKVDLKPFLAVLAEKTLVLHGSDYDLRMLRGSLGFRPGGAVIDTMIAAQLLGYEKLGLTSLVEQFSGVKLSKAGQKSDWSRRPLSPAQLTYAVDDTRYLEPLAERLLAELQRLGRQAWFDQSCAALIAATASDRQVDPEEAWRIKGVYDLLPAQAAVVRELWSWREREAQRDDRPPFMILGNEILLELALRAEEWRQAGPVRLPPTMRHVRGQRLESLLAALRRAGEQGPEEWPAARLRRGEGRVWPGDSFAALSAGVARLAKELSVTPSVIAPRSALEELSRRRLRDPAEIQEAGRLLPWQAELLAPLVLESQGGSTALARDDSGADRAAHDDSGDVLP